MVILRERESLCMGCNKSNSAHSGTEGDPSEGDLSVCGYCGMICLFDKELNLIPATPEQIQKIRIEEPAMYKTLQKAVSFVKEKIGKN